MTNRRFSLVFLVAITSLIPAIVMAETAPRWVSKGVKSLDKERTNDTYSFVKLNTHGLELMSLQQNGKNALITYVEETYNAKPLSTTIETLTETPVQQYKVTYSTQADETDFIIARLVDTYSTFDDFEENAYEFEYYQLYAVSQPNTIPMYDKFELTKTYRGAALVQSIIPGLGQMYKGQRDKGWVILGGEVGLAAASIVFYGKERYCAKQKKEDPYVASSWQSKENGWRNFKYASLGAAGVLYIYNLIDAAASKGARNVKVSKNTDTNMQLLPYAAPDNVGVAVTINF